MTLANAPQTPIEWTERVSLNLREAFAGAPGLKRVSLAPEFEVKRPLREGNQSILRSWAWRSPGLRWLRISEISGSPGNWIANVGMFPEPATGSPVMHAEIVVLRHAPMVLILDAVGGSRSRESLELLGSLGKAPSLPPAPDRPEWSRGILSAEAVWSRPESPTALEDALRAFSEWLAHMESVVRGLGVSHSGPDTALVHLHRETRSRFVEHDPSRAFLKAFYGADWAEDYISGFLFPRCLEEGVG